MTTTDPLTSLILDALATHRLTRLVTADVITQPARTRLLRWIYRRADDPSLEGVADVHVQHIVEHDDMAPKLATLVVCRWCAGMWISLGIGLVRRCGWWRWVRYPLALSSAAALLAAPED